MTPASCGQLNEKALRRRVKDHVVGSRHDFFVVCHPGFEAASEGELRSLGIENIRREVSGGLEFAAKLTDAYRVNLACGTIGRLLLRLACFKATDFSAFKEKMAALPWELYLPDQAAVGFSVSVSRSRLWHSGRLEADSLAAIAARMARFGRSAFAAPGDAAAAGRRQTVFIRFERDRCQVSLDSSGELLYKRGFDKFCVEAPLRDTLACAILKTAFVERYRILIDPFCGSGTFGLEAGLIFSGRPANRDRHFAFEAWPAFRPAAFAHLKRELETGLQANSAVSGRIIFSSDIAARAVRATARNIEAMGLGSLIEVRHGDFFKLPRPDGDPASMLLTLNPPYGSRLGSPAETATLYRRIGAKIRADYASCGYAVVVPGLELEKVLGLPYDRKVLFRNGGIGVSVLIHASA